tara:strand:- start:743 stop:1717 length:975 start_codon:yes stop_codon:yes gene_type:complete
MRNFLLIMVTVFLSSNILAVSNPNKEIKVGVLKFGTANWELKTTLDNGIDAKHDFKLNVVGLADKKATAAAFLGGEVDVILTDYLWISMQRSAGADFTFVPHSKSVGGIIVNPASNIASLKDLAGKKIGIAGGPVDKSWVILQAYANSVHSLNVKDDVELVFGAPPLINEKLMSGELDAVLNFWHYNARLKSAGMIELHSVADMLDEMGLTSNSPLLGWAFSEKWASENENLIKSFLDSSYETKSMLLNDMNAWENLKAKMKADKDNNLFVNLSTDYRAGIISEYTSADEEAAKKAFAVMAEIGGAKLVGSSSTLAPGTFWSDY